LIKDKEKKGSKSQRKPGIMYYGGTKKIEMKEKKFDTSSLPSLFS